MSFLNQLFKGLPADEQEALQERLDIITHKIKFMDKVPVLCLNTQNEPVYQFADEIAQAGGILQNEVENAVFILYLAPDKKLNDLMRDIPPLLNNQWPAVLNNRVVLIDDAAICDWSATNRVTLIEDFAEILHPGSFIFGYEGLRWIRFGS